MQIFCEIRKTDFVHVSRKNDGCNELLPTCIIIRPAPLSSSQLSQHGLRGSAVNNLRLNTCASCFYAQACEKIMPTDHRGKGY